MFDDSSGGDLHAPRVLKVKRSLAYPDWEHTYDVGIVVLDHPAAVEPRAIAAACSAREGLVAGALVHLVGFGLTTKAGTGDNTRLREAQIPIIQRGRREQRRARPAQTA